MPNLALIIAAFMVFKKKLSQEEALQKAKYYCSYQERSHAEVKEKLYGFGLYRNQVDEILAQLIEADYLNEERFAIQFVRGKFSLKKWGKIKIEYELKQKKISAYNIAKALKTINETDYKTALFELAQNKWKALKEEQYIHRITKVTNFLLQKGFEIGLIKEVISSIREK